MDVIRCAAVNTSDLSSLLAQYGIELRRVADYTPIPGSHFGDPEAGIIGNKLYIRSDTPLHSALHETCHYICMDQQRRERLHTDAGGDYSEENGVCFLQILLAEKLPGVGRDRMMLDMDRWGYSFRLGSSSNWFYRDAEDARTWLLQHALIDQETNPTGRLRT